MLPELEGLRYGERLENLGLYSLEHRSPRGKLIEEYKILRGMSRMNAQGLLTRVCLSEDAGFK